MIPELQHRITDEMEDQLFVHVPEEKANVYENSDQLFGKEVSDKWPNLTGDISEAGKCFAFSRFTASVFHLMRVMETGVQELGTKLSVPLVQEKHWQPILDEVNKAIKALDPKLTTTKSLAAVSANLYAVKLAWRNEVMHPKATYTPEEAEDVMRSVKAFMFELAKII